MERLTRQRALYISVLTLVILGIIFLLVQIGPWLRGLAGFLKAVLTPFLFAVVISYLLHPIVTMLSERGVPRSVAVLLIYTLFIASIVVVVMNLVPMFDQQLEEMAEHLPQWNDQIRSWIDQYDHNKQVLPHSVQIGIERSLDRLEQSVADGIGNWLSGIGSTLNQVMIALVVPFLAFYMLKDTQLIERSMLAFFPVRHHKNILRLFRDIDTALGNYIRGQLLVCLIVGVLAYVGYRWIGLPYPLLLASSVAVFNVVPYLGPFLGAIPAILVALAISKKMVVSVLLINLVIQMLEGNVISPQIVGRTLHLHPLLIIFALLAGGEVGGIWGMILAVPFFAVCKVIVEHVTRHVIHR
ncbi:AI-2E family transporter [Polycladomyces subterraneus]|uniref:AI-2E family transporter n=1 Tax=Polycladomyces subterraneus TaxID=1016997 RepID=A0ABT8ILR2_9BACL|nr:AI-2E family transporter [Polycladomyces subterraneus]MDN4593342.1 AI-2E family transporter [Polycladomyces subterraneus]